MKKDELSDVIDTKFNDEQKRHHYGKKQKIPKLQYIRPLFFTVIMSVTLIALVSKIYEVVRFLLVSK